jgi:DNA-binding NarL/FixJ family response regulator
MQPRTQAISSPRSVWIVEDSEDYARTVQEVFQDADDLTCPLSFRSGEELLAYLTHHFAPEVMLVDIGLPRMSGIDVVQHVRDFSPATQRVMLTIHEDNDRIFEAICSGANGYLLKTATPEEILDAVREVLSGGAPMSPAIARRVLNLFAQIKAPRGDYQLSDREQEILAALVDGKTKHEIARSLFLSVHTVDTHMRNIYAKLQVHSRTEAVVKAMRENLVSRRREG